jgi:hypothetical protein
MFKLKGRISWREGSRQRKFRCLLRGGLSHSDILWLDERAVRDGAVVSCNVLYNMGMSTEDCYAGGRGLSQSSLSGHGCGCDGSFARGESAVSTRGVGAGAQQWLGAPREGLTKGIT